MPKMMQPFRQPLLAVLFLPTFVVCFNAKGPALHRLTLTRVGDQSYDTRLEVLKTASPKKKEGYVPKWKKKQTLAEEAGRSTDDPTKAGLIGTIPVVFNQGNETRTTLALEGQPLSDVAVQAGQYIRYNCKKGECGTCACMVDGQWIRPCVTKIPALAPDQEAYTVTLKAIKNKAKSSGKFYSARSFVMGFYNNLLGMVGFVKQRRQARKNYLERMEIEDKIAQLALEKRRAREENMKAEGASKLMP